jgi:DNA repair protein RecO (recombination protein O)
VKHFKTEAVILDATDVFDADRSLLLFTRELGKLRARARGVRKPTSRLTGHLLPYVPTSLELVEGNSGLLITQAQIQVGGADATYPGDPLAFLRQSEIIAESLNRLYVEREPHPSVYGGLVYTLDRLLDVLASSGHTQVAELVAVEFLFKALGELGYRPELERCVVTSERLETDFLGWSDALGGVVSKVGWDQGGREGYRLRGAKTLVALRQFQKPEFYAERLAMPAEVAEEAKRVVYGYLQYTIGRPLKSLS